MTGVVAGDPSSCSQLGAELRSHAAALLTRRSELVDGSSRPRARGRGPVDTVDPVRLERDVGALDAVIDRLDAAGAALQRYAQELAAAADDERRLARDVARAGLELDGHRVVEPWGVAPAEVAEHRQAAQPELQARLDRLHSSLARARGAVRRTLDEGTSALGLVSGRLRDGLAG